VDISTSHAAMSSIGLVSSAFIVGHLQVPRVKKLVRPQMQ
jgi:hypothetical protein